MVFFFCATNVWLIALDCFNFFFHSKESGVVGPSVRPVLWVEIQFRINYMHMKFNGRKIYYKHDNTNLVLHLFDLRI